MANLIIAALAIGLVGAAYASDRRAARRRAGELRVARRLAQWVEARRP
jgi:hypothetical protein